MAEDWSDQVYCLFCLFIRFRSPSRLGKLLKWLNWSRSCWPWFEIQIPMTAKITSKIIIDFSDKLVKIGKIGNTIFTKKRALNVTRILFIESSSWFKINWFSMIWILPISSCDCTLRLLKREWRICLFPLWFHEKIDHWIRIAPKFDFD